MPAFESALVSQAVNVAAEDVYAFAARMENLPQWASGLAAGIEQRNGDWYTRSPMGEVKVEMAPANDFGVLDHDVTLPDGTTVHNAFRVTPCGDGSLLVFVVLRLPGVDPQSFDADVAHVRKDLLALKTILESSAVS